MPIAYASSTLTLTGGTTSSRLTPANIINDAAAFSTGSTYAVGAIVRHNAGGGLGTALYRCSTAVTVAGAFTSANWTLLAYIQGTNSLWLETSLVISAAYNDNGWAYSFAGGLIFAGNGCDWVSGSALNSSYNIGFTVTYTGTGLSAGGTNILTGTSGVVNWANVRFICPTGQNKGVNLVSSVMTGSIINCYFTYAINQSIDAPLIVKTNIASIYVNLGVNPVNLFGLTHSGLYEGSFTDNKFGVITASQSGSVVSGTRYAIAALGTATLGQWQAVFNTLTAIPAVGDVLTATASGTIGGSAAAKVYRALSRYTPDIPADNSRGVGFNRSDSLQFFEDLVIPAGFNFSTQLTAYFGGATFYFTRQVNIVAKQGANLLAGVNVRVVNTSNNSQLSIETTNASGAISKQMLIFYGERVGGGSYAVLQNTRDLRNKFFLFRRADLNEANYTADMTVAGVELTQFMSADVYYTADQSALAGIAGDAATKTLTISAALTLDQIYDWAKWWMAQPAQMASAPVSFLSPSGTVLTMLDSWTFSVTATGNVQAGAKLKTLVTAGTVTIASGGAMSIDYTDAAGTRVTIKERSGKLLSTYVTINGVPVGGTTVDGAFRAGFVPLATSRLITVQPTDQVRIAASYYGSKPAVFNILGSDIASFTLSLDVEPAIDTTVDTAKRDAIAASFDTVVNGMQVELTVNKTLSQYTPGEVVAGFSYYVASRGFVIAQSIVFANSVDFYALSTGTLTVYNPDFKFRLSDLDSTGVAITPTADGYTIPLVLQYVNPANGAKSHMTLLNASGALLGTAQWPQSQASVGDADQSSIAARTRAQLEASAVLAKESSVAAVGQAVSNLPAPPTAASNASAVRTELATELARIDTAVSTRLASDTYTPPANADIAAIKTKTDTLVNAPTASDNATAVRSALTTELGRIDVTVSSRLATSSYTAPTTPPTATQNASAVRTELATELGRIDTSISSRLASSSYTPTNAPTVTAIRNELEAAGGKLDKAMKAAQAAEDQTV